MDRLSVFTKYGLIFWLSLVGYIAMYYTFYNVTQKKYMEIEEYVATSQVFKDIQKDTCAKIERCTEFKILKRMDVTEDGKLILRASVNTKVGKSVSINFPTYNQDLNKRRSDMLEIANENIDRIEIAVINGNPVSPRDRRSEWVKNLITAVGGLV